MSPRSTSSQLRQDLQGMTDKLASVLRDLPVKYCNTRGRNIVIVAPNHYWDKPSAVQQAALHSIKRSYEEWIELLQSVFRSAPNDVERILKDTDTQFRLWLELKPNWSLDASPNQNEAKFRSDASQFERLLEILDSVAGSGVIVVPDTNSLVGNPDPVDYRGIAGRDTFTFLLLPTVLSELDDLKNLHRNPDFRDKAKKVITRIKGWRNQGSLRDGVTVHGTITVRAIANDPNMSKSLSWLDPDIQDDRVVASVLEVQASNPSDQVILVTGDINLLNKADAARINHAEI